MSHILHARNFSRTSYRLCTRHQYVHKWVIVFELNVNFNRTGVFILLNNTHMMTNDMKMLSWHWLVALIKYPIQIICNTRLHWCRIFKWRFFTFLSTFHFAFFQSIFIQYHEIHLVKVYNLISFASSPKKKFRSFWCQSSYQKRYM